MDCESRKKKYRAIKSATVAICLHTQDERFIPFGSGVNVDPAGIVVTCKHVIEGAQATHDESGRPPTLPRASEGVEFGTLPLLNIVAVFTFEEGGHMEHGVARFKAVHGKHDLDIAVARLKPDAPLPFVGLGNSDVLEEGDFVFTCGFPLGPALQPPTPSGSLFYRGIVSGIRPHHLLSPRKEIILDMSVNEGISGGPLCCEESGLVIGIVNARMDHRGLPTGIGMAVPSNLVKPLVETVLGISPEEVAGIAQGKWPMHAPKGT